MLSLLVSFLLRLRTLFSPFLLFGSFQALRLNPPKMKKGSIPRSCIKSLVLQFTEAGDRAVNKIEQTIAEKERTRLRRVIKDQELIIIKLEDELDLFRTAFNDRVLFFRSLQALSDSVVAVEVKGEEDLEARLMSCISECTLFLSLSSLKFLPC